MNLFDTYISPNAAEYVTVVLETTHLSEGKVVELFEKELERVFNFKQNSVVCVNSGTSALHLALVLSGIKLRQEVILPTNTFIATGLAIVYAGGKPVFADMLSDGTLDPKDVMRKITKRTKAILPVHWAGQPCNLDTIHTIAKSNDIDVIEDACQALGGIYNNQYIGNHSRFVCFSFQATKHLTTGDGGMIVCNNSEDYELAKQLRWFGIDRKKHNPNILGERVYNLDVIGYKYHMNNIAAAIGMANLETIKARLRYRLFLARIYENNLKSVIPVHQVRDGSSFWAYPVRVDNVKKFSGFCQGNNIPCSIIHRGIDHNDLFGVAELPEQRKWEKTVTHLPIHHNLSGQDVLDICEKVNQYGV